MMRVCKDHKPDTVSRCGCSRATDRDVTRVIFHILYSISWHLTRNKTLNNESSSKLVSGLTRQRGMMLQDERFL